MTLDEARELVNGPLWPCVKKDFLATGSFQVYPAGDERRLAYLDKATRDQIALWMKAIPQIPAWRKVIDGKTVRQLKADYPGVYPEVLRYEAYFPKGEATSKSLLEETPEATETGEAKGEATSKSLLEDSPEATETGEAKGEATSKSLLENQKKNTLKTLLKLKFPEAYKLCCS